MSSSRYLRSVGKRSVADKVSVKANSKTAEHKKKHALHSDPDSDSEKKLSGINKHKSKSTTPKSKKQKQKQQQQQQQQSMLVAEEKNDIKEKEGKPAKRKLSTLQTPASSSKVKKRKSAAVLVVSQKDEEPEQNEEFEVEEVDHGIYTPTDTVLERSLKNMATNIPKFIPFDNNFKSDESEEERAIRMELNYAIRKELDEKERHLNEQKQAKKKRTEFIKEKRRNNPKVFIPTVEQTSREEMELVADPYLDYLMPQENLFYSEQKPIKSTALYSPSLQQVFALARPKNIGKEMMDIINGLSADNTKIEIMLREELNHKKLPQLLSAEEPSKGKKIKPSKAQQSFTEGMKHYADGNYTAAFKSISSSFEECQSLKNSDTDHKETHVYNATVCASYMDYLTKLILDEHRKKVASSTNEQVDSLEELLFEEFEYHDPCKTNTHDITAANQPTERELNYAKQLLPEREAQLGSPEGCKKFKKAIEVVATSEHKVAAKSKRERAPKSKIVETIITDHSLRVDVPPENVEAQDLKKQKKRKTFVPVNARMNDTNPNRFYSQTNGRILQKLPKVYVNNYIKNVLQFSLPDKAQQKKEDERKPSKRNSKKKA